MGAHFRHAVVGIFTESGEHFNLEVLSRCRCCPSQAVQLYQVQELTCAVDGAWYMHHMHITKQWMHRSQVDGLYR